MLFPSCAWAFESNRFHILNFIKHYWILYEFFCNFIWFSHTISMQFLYEFHKRLRDGFTVFRSWYEVFTILYYDVVLRSCIRMLFRDLLLQCRIEIVSSLFFMLVKLVSISFWDIFFFISRRFGDLQGWRMSFLSRLIAVHISIVKSVELRREL